VKVYLDFHDWWVGYYRGGRHHYVCPLPCVVIRWARRHPEMPVTLWGKPVGKVDKIIHDRDGLRIEATFDPRWERMVPVAQEERERLAALMDLPVEMMPTERHDWGIPR
jgi:hypothetical protein